MKYEQLKKIAEQHSAVKTKAFSQNTYINGTQLLDIAIQDGACRALSAAFLVRNFSRAKLEDKSDDPDMLAFGKKNFFEAFHTTYKQSDADQVRFEKIATVQKAYAKEGAITEQESLDAAKSSVAVLSNRMLQYVTSKPALVCEERKAVDDSILPDKVGYWLLSSGGHMMAVAQRSDKKAKFFDPNAGLATFGNTADLRSFLSDYFKSANYNQVNFIEFKC